MGPNFWTPDKPSKLKKCSEFTVGACDTVKTDGCCGVIECTFCLTFEGTESTQYGVAEFATDGWIGTIAGVTFYAFWQRNYQTGECEFVVELDNVEVYRMDCYGGQSCRDSSDSAAVTIDYEDGTLSWTKKEPRPLEYIKDPVTHCTSHFCGTCECTCECMCVTVSDHYGFPIYNGEICDVSYPCDGPVWEGTVGDYVLSLALGRDQYGECIITATVDGQEQAPVSAAGCANLTAEITLADGSIITVRCKSCTCNTDALCCDRELPLDCITGVPSSSPGKLPLTLTCDLTATPSFGGSTCFNGSGTLTFLSTPDGGLCCWEGDITGSCTDCNGNNFNWSVHMTVCCGDSGWTVSARVGSPCTLGVGGSNTLIVPTACNPVLLAGCFEDEIVGCVVACTLTMPPTSGPTYVLCFDIYETP